jgi:hypothetical protein
LNYINKLEPNIFILTLLLGELLAPALVGFNDPQNYGELVAKRMNRAHTNLASGERPSTTMLADSE